MNDHIAVTTFNALGFETYGKKFIDSFLEHWDIPLYVFTECFDLPLHRPRLTSLDLDDDTEWDDFMERHASLDESRVNPNMQVKKFGHKVFAITSPALPESRWRIWLDADVETVKDVNEDALREFCPEDCCLSFLGRTARTWGREPVPETGFVGYRCEDARVKNLLSTMRRCYTTDDVLYLGENNQHDAYVLEKFRKVMGIPEQEQRNLSAGVPGINVWEHTVLGNYMKHRKGPVQKLKAYGRLA